MASSSKGKGKEVEKGDTTTFPDYIVRLGAERVKELVDAALLAEKTPPPTAAVTTGAAGSSVATRTATLPAAAASLSSPTPTTAGQLSSSDRHAMQIWVGHWDGMSNFRAWSQPLCSALQLFDLLGYLDGTTPCPTDAAGKRSHQHNSHLVFYILQRHMPLAVNQILSLYSSSLDPARQAWTYLMETYVPSDPLVTFGLERQLLNIRMSTTESAQQYITRATGMRIELESKGKKFTAVEFLTALLEGLPSTPLFDNLKMNFLTTGHISSATEGTVCAAIMRTWNQMHGLPPTQVHLSTSPLLPAPTSSGPANYSQLSIAAPPFSNVNVDATSATPKKFSGTCFYCSKANHTWRDCRKRAREDPQWVPRGRPHPSSTVNFTATMPPQVTIPQQPIAPPILPTPASSHSLSPSPLSSTPELEFGLKIDCSVAEVGVALRDIGWKVDTACGQHMTSKRDLFFSLHTLSHPVIVTCANGSTDTAVEEGSIRFRNPWGKTFVVHGVLLVPSVRHNLFSAGQFQRDGLFLQSNADGWWLQTREGIVLSYSVPSPVEDNQVNLDLLVVPPPRPPAHTLHVSASAANTHRPKNAGTLQLWHARFGHAPTDVCLQMQRKQLGRGVDITDLDHPAMQYCPGCLTSRLKQTPFPSHEEVSTSPLELVHSDLCDMLSPSWDKKRYMLVLVDQHTRYLWAYALEMKSETSATIQQWLAYAERLTSTSLKVFRSDQGGEFMAGSLQSFFKDKGIVHQTSIPATPAQNGVAERNNQTLLTKMRAVLHHMRLPSSWWSLALPFVVFLRNILPSRRLAPSSTPYMQIYGRQPDLFMLKVFGCMCMYLVPIMQQIKMGAKARWGIHAGMSETCKGWRIFDVADQRVIVSRDVRFFETLSYLKWKTEHAATHISLHSTDMSAFLSWENPTSLMSEEDDVPPAVSTTPLTSASTSAPPAAAREDTSMAPVVSSLPSFTAHEKDITISPDDCPYPTSYPHSFNSESMFYQAMGERASLQPENQPAMPESTSQQQPISNAGDDMGRGKRVRSQPDRLVFAVMTSPAPFLPLDLPTSWSRAMALPDASQWKQAADEEMAMLIKLQTWEPCTLPPGRRAIATRWVFTKKRQGETYSQYKARLVAKGFVQEKDRDYDRTWAPVVSHVTVRCLLALVAAKRLYMWQSDVKNAFLHGSIDRDIYIQQPEGYTDGTGNVLRLKKALYGLKQSPRCWYHSLRDALLAHGFMKSKSDPALFYCDKDGQRVWVAVYVDDLLLVSAIESLCESTFMYLQSHFTMKRIQPVSTYLGLQLVRGEAAQSLFLHQHDYQVRLVGKPFSTMKKVVDTPLAASINWHDAMLETEEMAEKAYKSLLGTLSYVSSCTRPDLAFAYSKLAQGTPVRGATLVQQLNRTIAYYLQTASYGLHFHGGELNLKVYSDANYISKADKEGLPPGDPTTCCSTTGWVAIFGGAAVSWKTSKQSSPSDSSCEAEFRAALDAAKEIVWLRLLLEELLTPQPAVPLLMDNESAVKLIHGETVRGDTRQLCRQLYYMRALVAAGEIQPMHVAGKEQVADYLTKPVPAPIFLRCRKDSGLVLHRGDEDTSISA